MIMPRYGAFLSSVGVALAILIACPTLAFAEGTGVNYDVSAAKTLAPSSEQASEEAALLATEEAKYQTWLAKKGSSTEVVPLYEGPPFRYFNAPAHKQANGYYCGPATCQIIDDYWGNYVSQSTYAAKYGMCPDSNGTIYSLMDDVLRYYTGKSYSYYPNVSSSTDFYGRVEYSLFTKAYPGSFLIKIDRATYDWRPYERSHTGHIVCDDGFSWVNNTIRIQDPYNEADYYPGGGNTYGHHTYGRLLMWYGVSGTPLNAIIY